MEGNSLIILNNEWDVKDLERMSKIKDEQVQDALKEFNSTIQACSEPQRLIKSTGVSNSFVECFHLAYSWHIPLQISPDHVWLTILQGFSKHVEKNSEKLRHKFVNFDGKQQLVAIRDEFQWGSPANDWAGVFKEFQEDIKGFIGEENHNLLCEDGFSTTTKTITAVYNLTLMDIMKSYFKYEVRTRCGIPRINLLGTTEDWVRISEKAKKLQQFDLDWWIPHLVEILDKFVEVFQGKIDVDFWNMAYKFHQGSGSGGYNSIEGWINNFFPYLEDQRSTYIIPLKEYQQRQQIFREAEKSNKSLPTGFQKQKGMSDKKIPSSFTKTPFIWDYLGNKKPMEFIGGFIGIEFIDNYYIQPSIQWAVGDEIKQKKPEKNEY